jgi:hypothetical protein
MNPLTQTSRSFTAFKIAIACILLFLTLSTLAMFAYPGGTYVNPQMTGYLFTRNFLSDLGRTTTFSGHPNTVSFWLFVIAISAVAFGLMVFFITMSRILRHHGASGWARLGTFFGIVAALGYFGVALTPWDLYGTLHLRFVKTAFLAFLPTTLCYAAAIFRTPHYPRIYGWVFLSCAMILIGYLWLLFFGPSVQTAAGLFIQVAGQKIIVYVQTVCVAIEIFGAYQFLNYKERIRLQSENARQQGAEMSPVILPSARQE